MYEQMISIMNLFLADESIDLTPFQDIPYLFLTLMQAFWPVILIGALIAIVVVPILGAVAAKWLKWI